MITKIRIRRFRSIDDLTIEFGRLTTLVGRNDVGKSNVARALNLFFNGQTDLGVPFDFKRDFNKNSKTPAKKAEEVVIEVFFKVPGSFEHAGKVVKWKKVWRENGIHSAPMLLEFTTGKNKKEKEVPSKSRIDIALERTYLQFVPATKGAEFFAGKLGDIYDAVSSDSSGVLRKSGDAFNKALVTNADELLGGLKGVFGENFKIALPENFRPIFESLSIKNDDEIPFDRRGDGIKVRHIPELLSFWSNLIDAHWRSPGSVRPTHLWIFEEPENNLEFSAAFEMRRRLQKLLQERENLQIMMTTHSPVFYDMTLSDGELSKDGETLGDNEEGVERHFFYHEGNFTKLQKIEKGKIDQEMGVLPVVANAVAEIQKKLEEREEALQEALQFLGQKDDQRKIFVEGETDRIVMSKALAVFFPEQSEEIEVFCAEKGGAQSAIDYLQAWQKIQQNRYNPKRAVAILDNDHEGQNEKKRIDESASKSKTHIKAMCLYASIPTVKLPSGFKSVIDLESLLSEDVWEKAKTRGWLEERGRQYIFDHCLPEDVKRQIVEEVMATYEERFSGLSSEQKQRLEFKFKREGKIAISNEIGRMDESEAKRVLANLEPTLNKAIDFLFWTPNRPNRGK